MDVLVEWTKPILAYLLNKELLEDRNATRLQGKGRRRQAESATAVIASQRWPSVYPRWRQPSGCASSVLQRPGRDAAMPGGSSATRRTTACGCRAWMRQRLAVLPSLERRRLRRRRHIWWLGNNTDGDGGPYGQRGHACKVTVRYFI